MRDMEGTTGERQLFLAGLLGMLRRKSKIVL